MLLWAPVRRAGANGAARFCSEQEPSAHFSRSRNRSRDASFESKPSKMCLCRHLISTNHLVPIFVASVICFYYKWINCFLVNSKELSPTYRRVMVKVCTLQTSPAIFDSEDSKESCTSLFSVCTCNRQWAHPADWRNRHPCLLITSLFLAWPTEENRGTLSYDAKGTLQTQGHI